MSSTIKELAHLQIPLQDIKKATNNFDPNNIISEGGFGPAYKGKLMWSGKLMKVAVRRLDRKGGLGDSEFWNEVSMLSDLKHTNLVSLIGFCDEKGEKIIITTYAANGSLGQFLSSQKLSWVQRLRICVGVARALSYLHSYEGRGYAVIHRFISSYTILLDENWDVKLSGFEISVKQLAHLKDMVVLCEPIGIIEYMDPAIGKTSGVTHKSDIYSFGVVLFEILCGREAYIKNEANKFLVLLAKQHFEKGTLRDIIHPNVTNQMSPRSLVNYSKVAYSCLKQERAHRPNMNDIVAKLEKVLELQLRYENINGSNFEHLKIPLDKIKLATHNFSDTYNIGFSHGCSWYRAKVDLFDKEKPSFVEGKSECELPKRHNTVVIKHFLPRDDNQEEELFFTEIEMLTSVKHHNIVTLIGFCLEESEMVLLCENFSNGYLSSYLGNVENMHHFTWVKRLKICIDVARALNYLHSEMEDNKMIIHNLIDSSNIGLDENWEAKIENFISAAFLPPKYQETDKLKKHCDVYSFGVVLFEIVCGKFANDPIYENGLASMVQKCNMRTVKEMIDPIIKEESNGNSFNPSIGPNKESLYTFLNVAGGCLAEQPGWKHPTMEVVLKELEKALMFQEDGVHQPIKDQVIDEELDFTHRIPEVDDGGIEGGPDIDRDVEKRENLRLRREILVKKMEHLKIRLSDIKLATNNFSEAYIIDSYDQTTLYKAKIDHFDIINHSSVEEKNKGKHPNGHDTLGIKRYSSGGDMRGEEDFLLEIEMLSCVNHPNIVTLFGFCDEDSEMILVIENVSNGYLANYLGNIYHDKRLSLTWEKRLKICIDIAQALNYLHYEMEDQKVIINGDINTFCIALDENFRATVVDFSGSVFLPPNQEHVRPSSRVCRFYSTDPINVWNSTLKRESDVYCFGVVLFEILCGSTASDQTYTESDEAYKKSHPPYDEKSAEAYHTSGHGLAPVARRNFCMGTLDDMIDPIIKEETSGNNFVLTRGPSMDSLRTFIEIAHQCIAQTREQRPTMKVVVKELEKALLFQKINKDNPRISLEDIKRATQNFHKDNFIGGGGFGKVYKGNLQDGDGFKTIVAKLLDTKSDQGEKQFLTELQILLEYKHENIIGLVGYCDEEGEKIIVYEYASKRSLDRYLNDASLTWVNRLNICINVASALDFLHGGVGKQAKVIHRDIKSANILLNHDWKAKLADFGLSIITPINQETHYVIDRACGTRGYLDPLYYTSGFLSIESDIYSFGVVMFEILCGRFTFTIRKHEGPFLDFIRNRFEEGKHNEVVFEKIRKQVEPNSLTTFQNIAYQCLHLEREKRPSMKEVLTQLKKALAFQNMASTITKCASLHIPLEDVMKATNNFHDDNFIGYGGFGTTYKGRLLRSGKLINIVARRLEHKHGLGEFELWTGVTVLSTLKHTNLVSIIGFCDEKDEKIIVTTGETNRILWQFLNNPNLTWTQRLKIGVGIARALSYLHYDVGRGYAIIHRIINSGTILLDENWEAKLSSFEYSVKQFYKDESHLCEPVGVTGYMDPEIEKAGGVTLKSDIYSFGVVLFEILCGKKAFIENEANSFLAPLVKCHYESKTLHDIIHPDLFNQILSPQSLLKYSEVAYSCLKEEQAHRPNMESIVDDLQKALEFQLRRENTLNNLEHLKIPLTDIKLATNNFSDQYKIRALGNCNLYRARVGQLDMENPYFVKEKNEGELPERDNMKIIKRIIPGDDEKGEEFFYREIEMLTTVKHRNIVTLLGFCVEGSEMILVTDNVSSGCLADYWRNVNDKRLLTWERRLKICIDVAHALNYLHSEIEDQKMIINRNIKSDIIGLDGNLRAKIYDFRLSVFLSPNQKDNTPYLNKIFGTKCYMDPEYEKTGTLKTESDVYGFGVVLFEILCGRTASDKIYRKKDYRGLASLARRSFCTGTLDEMIDSVIKEESGENSFVHNRELNKDSLQTFIEIAFQCVAEAQDQRPTMKVVVKKLEKALFFQENSKDKPKIPLKDVKLATQNFHDDNCIGREGFGKVYKGNLENGDRVYTIVAKRLDTSLGQVEKQFFSELQILWEYKHGNVVSLIGYCDEQDEKIIVYEYASRRSLDRYLSDASLTWMKRLNICIDVASALDFIHGGVGKQQSVIHRDIKTSSILLYDDWKAKLASFGLSSVSEITHETNNVIDHACGTQGYVDTLYKKSGSLSIESDIYSFGVVLFEILCGRSTIEIHEHEGRHISYFIKNNFEEGKHDEVVFKHIRVHIAPESLTTFQKIAYQCLHHDKEQRPKAKEVLTQLKKALAFQNMASTMTKLAPLQIPLEDVAIATNNFHPDNIIGHSGFGIAYKGRLLWSGRWMMIAARRFECKDGEADLEFLTEIPVLSDLKHTNLVTIIGFCDEKDVKIIITTYEANGSLIQYLNSPNLTWIQRLRICVGMARALSYLHYEEGRDFSIIHCNINSVTILIDENWEAKLSGFEFSIKQLVYHKDQLCHCEDNDTIGCMDPAIEKTRCVTHKSDTYSFGVVLFALLCGRKPFIHKEAIRLLAPLAIHHYENATLQDIIHPDMLNQMSMQSLFKYSSAAYSCLKEEGALCPNTNNIVDTLEKALESQLRLENIGKKLEHLKIPLTDIKLATNNFSKTYKIASSSGYSLYRSKLDHFDKENPSFVQGKGRNTVVIKRYPSGHPIYGEESFFTEVEMLSVIKHPNIVTLLGFCVENYEMILVTDNVSNGYLVDYLGNSNHMLHILTWEKRLKICIDVAHALSYLHSGMEDQKMIINRDIGSWTIGLDENYGAKIVDFCLSVFLPPNQEEEALYLNCVGRLLYMDPEYKMTRKLKRESDVYSFGVVLFEILHGRICGPMDLKESKEALASVARQSFCVGTLEDRIDLIKKEGTCKNSFSLNRGPNKDSINTFIEIAQWCLAETQDQRPTMEVVVKELEKALFLQENNKDNPRIPLEAIILATQNFHDDNCIGGPESGKVYKGNLQDGDGVNTIIAKRLDMEFGQGEKEFFSELQILWEYKHENVIGLVGYCDEHDEKIIVYEYASRGSLDKYLNDASLTWLQRLNICIDVASALDFIHGGVGTQANVIHGDIKAANILLNHDWKAKLADFGLSLISLTTQETKYPMDYACGKQMGLLYKKSGFPTIESDVCSFGVILFEILCGRSTFAIHELEDHYLPDFVKKIFEEGKHDEVVFEKIREQIMPESLTTFQEIAYRCLHREREKRPTTKEVLVELKKALEFQISTGKSTSTTHDMVQR